jgi:peptidase A4-like protein
VKNDIPKFIGKMFTKVQATWKVPSFLGQPANGETWYAAIFVGLDGGSTDTPSAAPPGRFSENLLQAGVAQIISRANGKTTQHCHAWYLWDPTGALWTPDYTNYPVARFNVSEGDTVTVILQYFPQAGASKGSALFLSDRAGQPPVPVQFNVDAQLFKGDTMEWIMERPADRNATVPRKRLAQFKPDVRLYNASGSASDGSPVAPNDGDTLIMEDDGDTHHLAEVTTVDSSSVSITFKAHI